MSDGRPPGRAQAAAWFTSQSALSIFLSPPLATAETRQPRLLALVKLIYYCRIFMD
jgi:hypothetical protein